jgi:endo-1,4-beta-xylanase
MQQKLQAQASIYSQALGICLSFAPCTAFVMWGFTDAHSWIPAATGHPDYPLIFDAGYHPKPAYDALLAALRASPSV